MPNGWFVSVKRNLQRMSTPTRNLVYVRATIVAISGFAGFSLLVGLAFAQVYQPQYRPQQQPTPMQFQQYAPVTPESAKDTQQDEHMTATDAILQQLIKDRDSERDRSSQANAERDRQIRDDGERLAKDEGIAIGAFTLITLLSAGGIVISIKGSDKKHKEA